MKLLLSVLLITLAVCCYEVNAMACPSFVDDTTGFFWQNKEDFEQSLQKYNAPPEKVQAVLDVKTCTDKITAEGKKQITDILGKIMAWCLIEILDSSISVLQ